MNNQQIMEDYLLVLKSTVEVYIHGTLESANETVREGLENNLREILSSQNKTYQLMMEKGWYPKENIQTDEINKTYNKLINKMQS